MAIDSWTPSRRLQSAAHAERQRVEREQRRVDGRVEALQRELTELQAAQASLRERRTMLDLLAHDGDSELIGAHAHAVGNGHHEAVVVADPPLPAAAVGETLRGSRIREAAVRALAQSPRAHEAVHYRDWYALLVDAGLEVGGKDPEASFLTQLSRSPVVRRSTQAGIYELDFEFIPRTQDRLQRLRAELRATHDLPDAITVDELGNARAQRAALQDEIDGLERRLQEALETLGDAPFGGAA